MAIEDLIATFGKRYPRGAAVSEATRNARSAEARGRSGRRSGRPRASARSLSSLVAAYRRLQQEALLSNPLIDFDRLLLVKRGQARLGLPQNWQGNCALPKTGYDNEIMVLSPVRPDGKLTTLYKPEGDRVRRRPQPELRRRQALVLHAQGPGPMADLGDQDRRQRAAAGDARRGTGCRQLQRLLPAQRPDPVRLDPLLPGRALRGRRQHGGEPVPHGGRRQPHAASLFRPGPRLVPVAVERRPGALHALGIHGHAPLLHPAAVPHESGRHGPDGVLQEQLAVAEFDLLCQGHPGPSDQGRGRHLRPSRRAADGRVGDLRSGQGTARGRRRRAAHSRLRRQGGTGHRRSDRRQVLAQVPAPAAAEREVLPRRP